MHQGRLPSLAIVIALGACGCAGQSGVESQDDPAPTVTVTESAPITAPPPIDKFAGALKPCDAVDAATEETTTLLAAALAGGDNPHLLMQGHAKELSNIAQTTSPLLSAGSHRAGKLITRAADEALELSLAYLGLIGQTTSIEVVKAETQQYGTAMGKVGNFCRQARAQAD